MRYRLDLVLRPAEGARPGPDGRAESLPEFGVHVAHRIDAVAVHAELQPVAEDLDEALHRPGVLGEDIVQAHEVTMHGVFPGEP